MVPRIWAGPFEYSRTANVQRGQVGEALRHVLYETKCVIYHVDVGVTRV